MDDSSPAHRFPNLFQVVTWEPLQCQFELCQAPPPASKIGNVNLVPFVGDRVLLLCLPDVQWDIPGGTLEKGEDYELAICRELLEEAGAHLRTFQLLGAWRCRSSAMEPYRPHLPHPEFYRLVGYGEVDLVATPTNPPGGEEIIEVACVSLEEATRRLLGAGRADLAELYRLPAAFRDAGTGEKLSLNWEGEP
jgi:8-oxo-dGTP diphosphatase